jgi:hypothetical protein
MNTLLHKPCQFEKTAEFCGFRLYPVQQEYYISRNIGIFHQPVVFNFGVARRARLP